MRTYRSSLAAPKPAERDELDKLLKALDAMREVLMEPVGRLFKLKIFMNANIEMIDELERILVLRQRANEMHLKLSKGGKKPKAIDVVFLLPLAEDVWDQAGGDPADSKNFIAFAWVMVKRCLIPLRLGPPSRDALKKAWSRHLGGDDV